MTGWLLDVISRLLWRSLGQWAKKKKKHIWNKGIVQAAGEGFFPSYLGWRFLYQSYGLAVNEKVGFISYLFLQKNSGCTDDFLMRNGAL